MKTIIARFTELKNNVSAAESEFEDLDYNKVDKALKSVGISLKDSMGQFRNLDDVFLELSEKWDTLDRNAQRYIATTAAGSRQQSRFLAMMENYDRTLELIETALNSVGRSSEQFAKYQDTIESKIKRLKTSWEKLRVSMLDPNKYKGAIEALTKIVEKLNKMDIKQIAAIGVTFATVGKSLAKNLISAFQNSSSAVIDAVTNPFSQSSSRITQIMVDGTLSTVSQIRNNYLNLSKELTTTLVGSGLAISSLLLSQLNSLNGAALQIAVDYMRANNELAKEEQELEKIKLKERERGRTEDEINTLLANLTTELGKQLQKIALIKTELQRRVTNLLSQGITDPTLLSGIQVLDSVFSGVGALLKTAGVNALTTAFLSALVTSITTVLAGGDIKEALVNSGKAVLIAAVPLLLSSLAGILIPKLITLITTTIAGPIVLAAGAVAATIGGIIWYLNNKDLLRAKKLKKLAEKEYEEAKEKYTTITEIANNEADKADVLSKRVKTLLQEIDLYKELNKISYKTTEQEELYNELINDLLEQIPELKNFYDERNNALTISNALLDEMLEKEKKIAKEATAVSFGTQRTQYQYALQVAEKESKDTLATTNVDWETKKKELNQEAFVLDYIDTNYADAAFMDISNAEYNEELAEAAWDEAYAAFEEYCNKLEKEWIRTTYNIKDNLEETTEEIKKELDKISDEEIDTIFNEEGQYTRDYLKRHKNNAKNKTYEKYRVDEEGQAFNEDISNYTLSLFGEVQEDLNTIFNNDKEAIAEYFEKMKTLGRTEFLNDVSNKLASLETYLGSEEVLSKIKEKYGDKLLERYNQDMSELMDIPVNSFDDAYNKFISEYNKYGLTSDLVDLEAIKKQYQELLKEINSRKGIQFLTQGTGSGLAYKSGIFNELLINQLSASEKINLNNFAEDLIDKFDSDEIARKYIAKLTESMSKLGVDDVKEQVLIMNFFNWDNVDASNLEEYKLKFFEWYKETINPKALIETMQGIFDAELLAAKDANLYDPLIKDFETYEKTIKEGYEELEKNAGLMKSIALEGEDALIDQSALDNFQDLLDKMYEANKLSQEHTVDEFFTWDAEKGAYTVSNAERLEKVWDKMSKSKLKDIASDALAGFDASIKGVEGNFENARKAIEKLAENGEINEEEWKAIKAYSEKTGSLFYKLLQDTKNWDKSLKNAQDTTKEILENIKKSRDTISSLISDVSGAAENMLEKGKINYSDLTGLSDTMEELAKSDENFTLSLSNYYDKLNQTFNYKKWIADMRAYLQMRILIYGQNERDIALLAELNAMEQELIDKEAELAKQEEETTEAIEDENEALERQKELEEAVADAEKELTDAQKNLADALKAVADAYEEIAEKEKAVLEVLNELNEAIYGTGDRRKSTLDGMYNYDLLIKLLTDDIADAKARLTNYESTDITGDINSYGQLVHNKKVMLLSLQLAYQNSLSTAKSLLSEYSAYYTEVNGRLLVDVAKLNSAAMPDKIKDLIESTISAYNDSVDKIHSITNDIKSLEKEFLDFLKTYRDKYINLQEKVIQTLKELAQEELNTEKEKYAALEEADNEYVNALEEAINKQRELRERANEEADLAQKEKKLSLMQRDTSGANLKDILKLQEDVDKTRQSLNDKKIDSIVKSLKDLYKTLKESRDAEIKYRETVLSNATFIEEANAVISSWQTADDLISWFMEHSTEVNTMTLEQLEKYSEELSLMYSDREIYMNTSIEDFTNMLNVTLSEINSMSSSVSETLSTEMLRAFTETRREVDKTIEELKEKLAQAEDAVVTAKDQLAQALDKVAEEVNNVKTATENLALASKDLANHLKDVKSAVDALGTVDAGTISSGSTGTGAGNLGTGTGNSPSGGNDSGTPTSSTPYLDKIAKTGDMNKFKAALSNIQKVSEQYWWAGKDNRPNDIMLFINALKEALNDKIIWGEAANGNWYFARAGKSQLLYQMAKNHGTELNVTREYKKGGLVNYTGPAWVDGTPALPEAFLNAEDTKNIATFTNVLSNLLSLTPFQQNQSVDNSTTTTINVTVNVDSINDDYDVHDAVQRVKNEIVAAANRVGSTVILHQ